MNLAFLQDNRIGKLHTNLGADVLVLQRFDGSDGVNELFDYRVEALSTEANIDFEKIIGTHATVELSATDNEEVFYDGIVTAAEWSGTGESGNTYILHLRPWVWLASKRQNQRIFHTMSAKDIIMEVLSDWAGKANADVEDRLTGSYGELEYTVQYQESDLDFACRMMEQYGISFHFTHRNGNHTMVLADSLMEYDPIPGDSRVYNPNKGHEQSDAEYFWEWKPKRHLTTSAVRMTDYNFKKPSQMMENEHIEEAGYAQGAIETYEYPGDYQEPGDGKSLAQLRTRQARSDDFRHEAVGNTMTLQSGMLLTLKGPHAEGVADQEYLCLSARHSFKSESYGSEAAGSDESYAGQFTFTPTSAPYAPKRRTPMPRIYGPQTATVVGDGEIDCDEFGRILVHFPWDLAGANSMRCRVAQISAHSGWGAMVLPRIGMEVVVEFLDGDPNKPLVTGCVYNGNNKPPYELPANKSQSGFLSVSHEGSGENQLRFEDQSGSEEIYMHAQKDHNTKILNNESHDIGVDRSKTVGNNQEEKIGQNKTITVGKDHKENIAANKDMSIGGNHMEQIAGNMTLAVARASTIGIALGHTETIGGAAAQTIGNSNSITVAKDMTTQVGKDQTTTVGAKKSITVADDMSTVVNAKKSITVEDELKITVGDASLLMKKDGTIILKGKDIKVDASKDMSVKAKSKINMKATSKVIIKGSKVEQN